MSERSFVCIPTELNHHPLLLRHLNFEEHALFIMLCLESNRYGRVAVNPDDIEFSLQSLLFRSERRVRFWSAPKIAAALGKYLAAGFVRRLDQNGRCWLEIDSELRYAKGVDRGAEPMRYEDQPLPLDRAGPELFVMPARAGPPPPHCNERTSREEKDKTSTRAPCAQGSQKREESPSLICGDQGCRKSVEETLLKSLSIILGPSEMLKNGGIWRDRIRRSAKAVAFAIEDYKGRQANYHKPIRNRAAWLTDRYERALTEITQASQGSTPLPHRCAKLLRAGG